MGITLNELAQLRDSGFGQPYPRHGLNLLYWFANECVDIDIYGRMVPKIRVNSGVYGFHRFNNRIDDDESPLPNQNLPKFEVGNLNADGADKLPKYVRENTGFSSNKDRIIVCLNDDGHFDRVYVAEHTSQTNFSRSYTHRVSRGLLKIIKNLAREDFLQKTKQPLNYLQSRHTEPTQLTQIDRPPENNSWCVIL